MTRLRQSASKFNPYKNPLSEVRLLIRRSLVRGLREVESQTITPVREFTETQYSKITDGLREVLQLEGMEAGTEQTIASKKDALPMAERPDRFGLRRLYSPQDPAAEAPATREERNSKAFGNAFDPNNPTSQDKAPAEPPFFWFPNSARVERLRRRAIIPSAVPQQAGLLPNVEGGAEFDLTNRFQGSIKEVFGVDDWDIVISSSFNHRVSDTLPVYYINQLLDLIEVNVDREINLEIDCPFINVHGIRAVVLQDYDVDTSSTISDYRFRMYFRSDNHAEVLTPEIEDEDGSQQAVTARRANVRSLEQSDNEVL